MPKFSLKKIITEENNFGLLSHQLRLTKGLEMSFVSRKLGIKEDYLDAIEKNRLDLLPSGIYRKGFLKKYAEFLGLDKKILANKLKDLGNEEKDDPFINKKITKKHLIAFPKIIKTILFSLAILACSLYLIFYVRKIVTPPELKIIAPEDNLLTEARSIEVVGVTEVEAELKINGEIILSNQDGNFSQIINLKSGLNNIIISAKKKYSQENIIIKQVLVE